MVCEVRENGKEVVLSHVTVGDVAAFVKLFFLKDKEVVFTRPDEGVAENNERS